MLATVGMLLVAAVALYFGMDYAPGRQVVWRVWFPHDARQAIIDTGTKSAYLLDDKGYLSRINERGRISWRRAVRIPNWAQPLLLAGPEGGAIVCWGKSVVQCYNEAGDLIWRVNTKIDFIGGREIDVTGKPAVVVVDDDRYFFGIDADGGIAWVSTELPPVDYWHVLHRASDGGFFYFSQDQQLVVLSNDGTVKWSYLLKHNIAEYRFWLADNWEENGEYYICSYEYNPKCGMVITSELVKLDTNGKLAWCIEEQFDDSTPLLLLNGDIIASLAEGELISYAAGGTESWRRQVDHQRFFQPTSSDGKYVIGCFMCCYTIFAVAPTGADPDHDCSIVRYALAADLDSHLVLETGRILTLAYWDF